MRETCPACSGVRVHSVPGVLIRSARRVPAIPCPDCVACLISALLHTRLYFVSVPGVSPYVLYVPGVLYGLIAIPYSVLYALRNVFDTY